MKKFLLKILLLIVIVSIIIMPIHIVFMRNYVDLDSDLKNKFYNVPYDIEICNFGTSHGQHGYNYSNIKSKYNCFNFALSSQALSYDYRVLMQYKGHIKEGAYIFIPVSDFILYGKKQEDIDGYLNKNQRYYYFLSPSLIENFDIEKYIYVKLPWLNCSNNELLSTLLNKNNKEVNVEKWDKIATYEDCVEDTKNRTGIRILEENANYYYKTINNQELTALYNMIDLCNEIKAIPVLVIMPMTGAYSETINEMDPEFFTEYYSLISRIVNETNVKYVDYRYDERISDNYDYFCDSDHLNDDGAKAFVDILIQEVVEK